MDEELDAVVSPHAPLPLSNVRRQYKFEVDLIRVDAVVDAGIRLDPVAIDVARIWLFRAKLPSI